VETEALRKKAIAGRTCHLTKMRARADVQDEIGERDNIREEPLQKNSLLEVRMLLTIVQRMKRVGGTEPGGFIGGKG